MYLPRYLYRENFYSCVMSLWPNDLNKEGKEGSFKNTTTYPVWSAIENLLKHPHLVYLITALLRSLKRNTHLGKSSSEKYG